MKEETREIGVPTTGAERVAPAKKARAFASPRQCLIPKTAGGGIEPQNIPFRSAKLVRRPDCARRSSPLPRSRSAETYGRFHTEGPAPKLGQRCLW